MINFNKLNLVETIEAEQASSEKAAMSSEKKNNPSHLVRQKSQMAGKMSTAKKSDVVYASEEYFRRLTSQVKLYKAQESAKVDWRETLEEAKKEKRLSKKQKRRASQTKRVNHEINARRLFRANERNTRWQC